MDPVKSVDLITAIYPGRAALNTREVARLLFGRQDRSAVQSVIRLLNAGTLIPDLRRLKGRWLIPIAALGAGLDKVPAVPTLRSVRIVGMSAPDQYSPTGRRRRKTNIGPRPGIPGY